MKTLAIELRKEKRTGVIPVLLAVGILGKKHLIIRWVSQNHLDTVILELNICL